MRHVRMTVLVAAAVLAAACGLVGDTTGPREPEFARVVRVVYRRNPGIYGWSEICLHLNGQLDEDDVRDPKRVSLGGLGFSPGEDLGNPYVASADRAIGWRTFIWDRKFEPGGVLATELAVGVEHEVWVADDCLGCGGEIEGRSPSRWSRDSAWKRCV